MSHRTLKQRLNLLLQNDFYMISYKKIDWNIRDMIDYSSSLKSGYPRRMRMIKVESLTSWRSASRLSMRKRESEMTIPASMAKTPLRSGADRKVKKAWRRREISISWMKKAASKSLIRNGSASGTGSGPVLAIWVTIRSASVCNTTIIKNTNKHRYQTQIIANPNKTTQFKFRI